MITPDAPVLSMLKTALEMEEKGFKFYGKAMAECRNALGQNIFTMLQHDEQLHIERIKSIFSQMLDLGVWTDDWKKFPTEPRDLGQVFRKLAAKYGAEINANTTDLEAIDVGLDFEHKSVQFYEAELARATNAIEREFAKAMVKEEETHFALLADMKLYYTDTESWFREHENTGLDGA